MSEGVFSSPHVVTFADIVPEEYYTAHNIDDRVLANDPARENRFWEVVDQSGRRITGDCYSGLPGAEEAMRDLAFAMNEARRKRTSASPSQKTESGDRSCT